MMSIILAIISFFVAKKKGASTAAALGIAAGVGAASWALADPQNPNAVWGDTTRKWFGMDKAAMSETAAGSNVGNLSRSFDNLVTTTGDVAKSWGPVGTAGAGLALTNGKTVTNLITKYWWVGAGLAGLWILSK